MSDKMPVLEFEGDLLVKVNMMRPEYMGGYELIGLVRTLALLVRDAQATVARLTKEREGRFPGRSERQWVKESTSGNAPAEDSSRYGWTCTNCRTSFRSDQQARKADDTNGGPVCPRCKAHGQYTFRNDLHSGDPCVRCGISHDEVPSGPCAPSAPAEVEGLVERHEDGCNLLGGKCGNLVIAGLGCTCSATALTALQAENERLRRQRDQSNQDYGDAVDSMEALADARDDWKARAEKAEALAGAMREAAASETAQARAHRSTIVGLTAERDVLKAMLKQAEEDFDIVRAELEGSRAGEEGALMIIASERAEVLALRRQLAEARASAAAAYERAAQYMTDRANGCPDYAMSLVYRIQAQGIRALATEAETTALAEIVDAETRACAELFSHPEAKMVRDRILDRIKQRKEAGA